MLALANKLSLTTQPVYKFVNKYSIDFDGVDDRIVTDGADTVLQNTTYSFWCKTSESGSNTVFGHGALTEGSFSLNYLSDKPLLGFSSNTYVYWQDVTAQDDGEWHHWVVYADATTIGNCKLYIDGVLQTQTNAVNITGYDAYTESLTIGGSQVSGGSYFNGQIDEFAVYDRELTQDEITRMYNTYYSPNRVANGNFAQIGNEEVTNGDFSQIGSEEVINGDFATDSNWTKQDGWTISGGQAHFHFTGTGNRNLYQNVTTVGKFYKFTFEITSLTQGSIRNVSTSITDDTIFNTVGVHTLYYKADIANLYLKASTDAILSIDNVSVKEVGQDWTVTGSDSTHFVEFLSTGARFVSDTVSPILELKQNAITSGKQYVLTCNVAYTGAGQLRVNVGSNLTAFTEGANTRYFTATSNTMSFLRENANVDALLSNVSVKEVGQHWTFGTGWSVEDNQLVSVAGTAAYTSQSGVGVVGRTYKVIADVAEVTAGLTYVYTGQGGTYYTINSAGVYTFSVVWDSISSLGIYKNASFAGKYNSITIQELKHDATNLMLNAGDYQAASDLQNYYRMGDGILDDYPLIADQTNPSLGSNLVEVPSFETTYTSNQWLAFSTPSTLERSTNQAYEGSYSLRIAGSDGQGVQASATQFTGDYTVGNVVKITAYVYPITSPNNAIKTGVNGSDRSFNTLFSGLTLNQWNKVEYYITISTASNNYISFLNSGTGEFYLDTVSAEIIQGNPGYMTNMSASDIILDTPNEPN